VKDYILAAFSLEFRGQAFTALLSQFPFPKQIIIFKNPAYKLLNSFTVFWGVATALTESQRANWRCPVLEKPVVMSMLSSLTNVNLDGLPLPA